MRTRPQAAPAVKQLSLDARADLLRRVPLIRRNAIELKTSKSMALRSRMNVMVNQLFQRVIDLDPSADVAAYSQAIYDAFGTVDWDAIVATCAAFEAMLEGKAPQYPIEAVLAAAAPVPEAAPATVAAPAPIAAVPVPASGTKPPAVPVADRDAPAPAPADPQPEQGKPEQGKAEQAKHYTAANDQADTAPANDDARITVAGITAVEKLGKAIRLGRVSKHMTQQEVATAAGVGRRFIVELESGKGKSEIGRIFAVCQVVGVTLTAIAA